MALLEIENLRTHISVSRGVVRAVDGISLHVDPGETVGLVGESGCGKTMTALSIIGLLPAGGQIVSGTIRLAGREISRLDDDHMRTVRGNDIGMIFQDPLSSLNPTMTIGKQIAEAVILHRGVSRKAAYERAAEVLNLVGLPRAKERVGEYPHQFSGGMRQRVMIAMALACEPRLLIADEPTTALDVTIQKQILELLDDLRSRLRMSVILVTHDLGVIAGQADRVAVMYAGKIVEITDTRTLYARPRHPYTEALFHALPDKATQNRERLYSIPGSPPDLMRPPPGCRFALRCRYARHRCSQEEPQLTGQAGGHLYACFYPVGTMERSAHAPVQVTGDQAGEGSGAAGVTGEVLLSARRLVKDFPLARTVVLRRRVSSVSAVADVSFDIRRGETFGLVGESGCGKTTIGRLIVGLEKPTGGVIRFQDENLAAGNEREYRRQRRMIQYMFQDCYASLDPRMQAGTILREPLWAQHIGSRKEQLQRVRDMLRHVGLPDSVVERYPRELSGGQQQRLGLARALIVKPRLVVADEPVSALDVSIQAQVLNLMRELQQEMGLTYLFISHDLAVVRYMSDRIGVMYLGKLIEVGPASEVYSAPVHPYTQGLIDSVPIADPRAENAKAKVGVIGELPSAISPPSGCRFRTRCPLAQKICAEAEPPLTTFSADGHRAACHFPLRAPDGGRAGAGTGRDRRDGSAGQGLA